MTAAVTGGHHRTGGSRCRSDSVDLAAHPAVVAQARLRSRLALRDWGIEGIAEETAQIVSEIVTNAVTATRAAGLSTGIRLALTADESGVLVAVWDGAPAMPVQASPDLDSESGRGLLLVDALAEWHDVRVVPEGHGGGKLVRAKVAIPRSQ